MNYYYYLLLVYNIISFIVLINCKISNITLSINCDNHCFVYINGKYQLENYDWTRYSIINTTINIDYDVIAINLINWNGLSAIRSNIILIDENNYQYGSNENWKCINSKQFENWNMNDYNDDHWKFATTYGNGNDIWGDVGYINTTADWITSSDVVSTNVLCRFKPTLLNHINNKCLITSNTSNNIIENSSSSLSSSLLVVIPGFGNPESSTKLRILRENIIKIKSSSTFSSVKFHIFQYDTNFEMPLDIINDPIITITKEIGIIGQFLYKYITPNYVNQYDYVLLILDDVEILDVNWNEILLMKTLLKYDIASCCLKEEIMSFWDFSRHLPDKNIWIREQPICELFCYLLDNKTYERYYQFIDYENPWMWGMDLILKSHMNLNCAVFNKFIANHHIRGGHTNNDATHQMGNYLKKYNTTWEIEENRIKIERIITTP